MRVLVSTTAGSGHFGPLVPFARALGDAGHHVVVAAPASFASAVERAGFVHQPFGDAPPEELKAVFDSLHGASNEEGNAIVVTEVFGRIDTRAALPGVQAFVEEWRPHLVLRETTEFASYLVAEASRIPHVHVAIGLAGFGRELLPQLDQVLTELGATRGVSGLLDAPRLSLVPESLDDPVDSVTEHTRRFRDEDSVLAPDPLPDWWAVSSDPLVYVSFGSVAAGLGLYPDLYRAVMAAVAELPVRVLLTIGDAGDPALLRPLPANVHAEKWWPQEQVMPHAAAMVSHGGFGTTLLGLAGGVPMVVIPLFADQPYNARRVEAVGAGIALDGGSAAVEQLPAALQRVLNEQSYRAGAQAVADDIRRLPPTSASVPYLEQLAG